MYQIEEKDGTVTITADPKRVEAALANKAAPHADDMELAPEHTDKIQVPSREPVKMVSGYVTLHNATKQGYPYEACIRSLAKVCDEVVALVTTESEDGTVEKIESFGLDNVRVVREPLPKIPGWDGELKHIASTHCKGDVLVQMDADEFFHPHSLYQARAICMSPDWGVSCLASLVFNYHGPNKGRITSKWRFFRNDKTWRHGIPPEDRGPKGTAKKTDGCFPYELKTGYVLPLIVPHWGGVGFWPIVMHIGGVDMVSKLRRHRDSLAHLWNELRPDGKADEATTWGDLTGKTDAELEEIARRWIEQEEKREDMVPPPQL